MGVLEEFAPTFVQKPGLKRKDGGLRIECEIQASPVPTVKWSKGDQEVREDEHLRCGIDQTGGSLYVVYVEIKNATQADAGQYSLRASNKLGNVISTVNLDFEAPGKPVPKVDGQPPTFCVKPTVRHDKERNRLVFTCGILADPKPEVTWLRNDVRLTDVGRHGVVLDADGKSRYDATLSVDRVTVEDAGSYKIIARNVLGETTGTITINLDSTAMALPKKGIKPTFTHKPVIQQSEDGDTITFECRLSSDPKSTIAWYHGDKQMRESGRWKMSMTGGPDFLLTLEIGRAVARDAGEYRCVATSKRGEATCNITLSFEEAAGKKLKVSHLKAPRYLQKPTLRLEGGVLIMECIMEADPQPEVRWFHDNTRLQDGGRFRVRTARQQNNLYLLVLEISQPKLSDGGVYRCCATNGVGESNANITLNLEGGIKMPPEFIEKPAVVPSQDASRLIIECLVRAKPDPDMQWYFAGSKLSSGDRYAMQIRQQGSTNYLCPPP